MDLRSIGSPLTEETQPLETVPIFFFPPLPFCSQMCNEWAIDTPCPAGGRDFCRSLHILDSRGNSVLASKFSFFLISLSLTAPLDPSEASRLTGSRVRAGCQETSEKRVVVSSVGFGRLAAEGAKNLDPPPPLPSLVSLARSLVRSTKNGDEFA